MKAFVDFKKKHLDRFDPGIVGHSPVDKLNKMIHDLGEHVAKNTPTDAENILEDLGKLHTRVKKSFHAHDKVKK